jgi:hypothetical protein
VKILWGFEPAEHKEHEKGEWENSEKNKKAFDPNTGEE